MLKDGLMIAVIPYANLQSIRSRGLQTFGLVARAHGTGGRYAKRPGNGTELFVGKHGAASSFKQPEALGRYRNLKKL
jgi:hypothetical protein